MKLPMIDTEHPLVKAVASVQDFADQYIGSYEMYCEDEDGREGVYNPNERETMILTDAINGLICDEDFLRCCRDEVVAREAQRLADGECILCGHVNPDHWGNCKADAQQHSEGGSNG